MMTRTKNFLTVAISSSSGWSGPGREKKSGKKPAFCERSAASSSRGHFLEL